MLALIKHWHVTKTMSSTKISKTDQMHTGKDKPIVFKHHILVQRKHYTGIGGTGNLILTWMFHRIRYIGGNQTDFQLLTILFVLILMSVNSKYCTNIITIAIQPRVIQSPEVVYITRYGHTYQRGLIILPKKSIFPQFNEWMTASFWLQLTATTTPHKQTKNGGKIKQINTKHINSPTHFWRWRSRTRNRHPKMWKQIYRKFEWIFQFNESLFVYRPNL